VTEPAGQVCLSPENEAQRLWDGAQEAFRKARQGIVHLSEAVDLGVRVVEIMTTRRLQPVRDEFPASIASLLESPPPDVDPRRDFLNPPKSLRFIDALDMLSAADLPCISPQLHHGWEDRVVSCRRSRARTRRATGVSVDEKRRDALILIGAYRNRIFVLPPPVRIVPDEVASAYPTLVELVEHLFASATGPAG
jgi:hypothetical protein